MNIKVIQADYHNKQHQRDIPLLLNAYASDPMGGAKPLDDQVVATLVDKLAQVPQAFSVLIYVDEQPAALANCFEAFSTFRAKPLVNIHDICVLKAYRGLGLSQKLLLKIEEIASSRGCCKLTLEVLSNNDIAKSAYQKFGFEGYELDPAIGHAVFWQKPLGS